jgi:uncharacterized protein (DUF2164 family)
MEHRIIHQKPFLGAGVNLIVHLDFTEHEHRLIRDNNMAAIIIVEREKTIEYELDENRKKQKKEIDNNIYFSEFYGRRTSWHADSVLEAKDFHAKLFEGFKRFQEYLEINSSPGKQTDGDFSIKAPPEFSVDLVPDYMWAQHSYILAESGGGKTQLLQTIIAQQMQKQRPPGFVIIDSQNQMLQLIQSKFPQAIMIDPLNNPPSLDLFNPQGFDSSSTLNNTLDTFRYLFEAGAQPLTDRQSTPFSYGIALMLVGYPKAFGRTAAIEDFEDYLTGTKKGMELTARAHQAVDAMGDEVKPWYYNQYGNFRQSHSEILQRLTNICGPFSPLRPLFKKQYDTLNLLDAVENGSIILVNTNRNLLGPYASSFFGRFFFKLLDRQIGARTQKSPPLFFIVDEVQEYFDATVITPFLDQARKRNISCIFAHQRLSQLNQQDILRDALTGVGTLMATNVNSNDIREVSTKFHVEQEQVHAWRRQYVENGSPTYADFGLSLKGKSAETFRLTFGQLEKLPTKQRRQQEQRQQQYQEPPRQEKPSGPPKDHEYDGRYDILESMTIHPGKARKGFILTVKCPNKRSHQEPIPPNTENGYRFCVKGASTVRRPDNKNGNFWVELEIPVIGAGQKDGDETDAKPW